MGGRQGQGGVLGENRKACEGGGSHHSVRCYKEAGKLRAEVGCESPPSRVVSGERIDPASPVLLLLTLKYLLTLLCTGYCASPCPLELLSLFSHTGRGLAEV